MFDEFKGGRVGRRCCVTVIANLNNLGSGRLCLQQMRSRYCLAFNLSHWYPIFFSFILPVSGTHTVRFRLKYCLKTAGNPNNNPSN